MIESGQLVIDGVTYTFDNTKNLSASTGNIIGIKDWDPDGDYTKNSNAVADRLVKAAGGASGNGGQFIVGHTDNTITLQVKTGVSAEYTEGKNHDDATKVTEEGWSKGLVSYGKSDPGKAGEGLKLQIGDTSDKFNRLTVGVGDMHVKAMVYTDDNGKSTSIEDIDIGTQAGAQKAVDVVKNAINYVSSVRGDLGAIQNRLEHTGNNLSVMAENIQDAESTIRDTDVASEMMSYVKNNILVQSAQAMLAQANQVPQGVLQLLG